VCLDDGIVGRLSNERCRVVWKKYEPDGQCVWQVDQFKGKELSDQMRLGGPSSTGQPIQQEEMSETLPKIQFPTGPRRAVAVIYP
jgi:hypothetical protein